MSTLGSILSTIERIPSQADGLQRVSVADLRLVARTMREAAAKLEVIADCHEEVIPRPRVIAFPRRLRLVEAGAAR
jgi:hypothetical protein